MGKEFKVDLRDTDSRGGKKRQGGRVHYPEGDYAARCIKADLVKSGEKGTPGLALTFVITQGKLKNKQVRDTLWLTEKSAWRIRQCLEGMGKKVPSKLVKLNTDHFVKGECAITLEDDEYDGKIYSRISDFFLLSEFEELQEAAGEEELESDDDEEEEVDEDDDTEEDDNDSSDDDEDDDLEELDIDDL